MADMIAQQYTGMTEPRPSTDRGGGWWRDAVASGRGWISASLIAILGAKLVVIGTFGNVAPFYDQWHAEFDLYHAYLNDSLSWHGLVAAHHEHRILLSRLLFLVILEVAGSWNTILEMIVDAVLHLAVLIELIWLLRRYIGRDRALVFAILLAGMFAIPFDWENVLWGFQSQFYFLLGLSLLAVTLIVERAVFSPAWLAGVALAGASAFAMSSGALTPFAAVAVLGAQALGGDRARTLRELAAALVLLAVGGALLSLSVAVPDHEVLRAHGIREFVRALVHITEWPFNLSLAGPVLINVPIALLALRLLSRRSVPHDAGWRLLAIYAWLGVQCAATAYARAADPTPSRYVDLIALIGVTNLCAAFHLSRSSAPHRMLAAGWMAALAASLIGFAATDLPRQWPFDRAAMSDRDRNLAAFVQTDDPRALLGKGYLHIPHVDGAILARIARAPDAKGLLPLSMGAPPQFRHDVQRRLLLGGGLRLEPERVAKAAYRVGLLMLAAAAALMIFECGRMSLAGSGRGDFGRS